MASAWQAVGSLMEIERAGQRAENHGEERKERRNDRDPHALAQTLGIISILIHKRYLKKRDGILGSYHV